MSNLGFCWVFQYTFCSGWFLQCALLARSNLNIQFSKKTDCNLDQNVKDNKREEAGNRHQEWAQVKHPKSPVSEVVAALAARTLPKGTSVVSGSEAPSSSVITQHWEQRGVVLHRTIALQPVCQMMQESSYASAELGLLAKQNGRDKCTQATTVKTHTADVKYTAAVKSSSHTLCMKNPSLWNIICSKCLPFAGHHNRGRRKAGRKSLGMFDFSTLQLITTQLSCFVSPLGIKTSMTEGNYYCLTCTEIAHLQQFWRKTNTTYKMASQKPNNQAKPNQNTAAYGNKQ